MGAVPEPEILIRGASGFLGANLAAFLAPRAPLRLFTRRAGRLPEELRASPRVQVVEGDALDERAVAASLDGIRVVVDLVGGTLPAMPRPSVGLEVELPLRSLAILLDQMALRGTPHLVFPSSGGTVYGRTDGTPTPEDAPLRPESHYGLGKLLGEEAIRFQARRTGLRYLILRFSNPFGRLHPSTAVQGAVDVFLERVRSGLPVSIWGAGDQRRDFIFIDDAVEAAGRLLLGGVWDETFNVGTGVATSIREVLREIASVTGREARVEPGPGAYPGVPASVLDVSRLKARTGWEPRYGLREGIAEAWRRLSVTPPAGR